jgi:hypothetical protein
MPKEKLNGSMKMLQIPISKDEWETLKKKADKEKRTLPTQCKIFLQPYMSEKVQKAK